MPKHDDFAVIIDNTKLTQEQDEGSSMRTEVFRGNVSLYFVRRQCPWAAKITRIEGGYMAFQSIEDWKTWKRKQ